MPKRIQRSRSKGWKVPEGTIYVGRPTKWGNPFVVGTMSHDDPPQPLTAVEAVALFEDQIEEILDMVDGSLEELRGKDLACWCPLDQPCHADVLLRLANKVSIGALNYKYTPGIGHYKDCPVCVGECVCG